MKLSSLLETINGSPCFVAQLTMLHEGDGGGATFKVDQYLDLDDCTERTNGGPVDGNSQTAVMVPVNELAQKIKQSITEMSGDDSPASEYQAAADQFMNFVRSHQSSPIAVLETSVEYDVTYTAYVGQELVDFAQRTIEYLEHQWTL